MNILFLRWIWVLYEYDCWAAMAVELSSIFVIRMITKTAFVMTNWPGQVQLFIAIDMFIIIAIDMIEMTILFSIDMFIIIRIDRWWAWRPEKGPEMPSARS